MTKVCCLKRLPWGHRIKHLYPGALQQMINQLQTNQKHQVISPDHMAAEGNDVRHAQARLTRTPLQLKNWTR